MVKSPSRVLPIPGGITSAAALEAALQRSMWRGASMLLVTYEGEHNHTQSCPNIDTNLLLAAG
ncbi:unnamed protein product, partial [Musa textilis]